MSGDLHLRDFLRGEQVLTALIALLVTLISGLALLAVAVMPSNASVTIAMSSASITALASLVRRHDPPAPAPAANSGDPAVAPSNGNVAGG